MARSEAEGAVVLAEGLDQETLFQHFLILRRAERHKLRGERSGAQKVLLNEETETAGLTDGKAASQASTFAKLHSCLGQDGSVPASRMPVFIECLQDAQDSQLRLAALKALEQTAVTAPEGLSFFNELEGLKVLCGLLGEQPSAVPCGAGSVGTVEEVADAAAASLRKVMSFVQVASACLRLLQLLPLKLHHVRAQGLMEVCSELGQNFHELRDDACLLVGKWLVDAGDAAQQVQAVADAAPLVPQRGSKGVPHAAAEKRSLPLPAEVTAAPPPSAAPEPPQKRGRGRPPKNSSPAPQPATGASSRAQEVAATLQKIQQLGKILDGGDGHHLNVPPEGLPEKQAS